MKSYFILLIAFLSLISCAEKHVETPIKIQTIKADDRAEELLMSSLVDTVKFISLDNRELVGGVDQILWTKDRLLLLDSRRTKKIFIYTIDGKLITSIESGSGEPGKFVWPYAPTLNTDEKSFFVVSDATKRILQYNMDGGLLTDSDISHLGQVDDMIATKNGFAFSLKQDSHSSANIVFTDHNFQITGEVKASDFYEQLPFVSGGASNSFYPGQEIGHFYYQEIMTNMILEVKDEKIIRVFEIDLPDSYEVNYEEVGRSISEVIQSARENGLVKLNDNHVTFGSYFLVDMVNSGRGALVLLDLEKSQMKFISNLKNDLSILINVNAIWGSYNNSKGKLITALEAPLMKQVLQNKDFSQSSYASIIEGLSVNEDDNPILIVYELKEDFVWPFD